MNHLLVNDVTVSFGNAIVCCRKRNELNKYQEFVLPGFIYFLPPHTDSQHVLRSCPQVVWRKLGNVKAEQVVDTDRSYPSPPVYENLQSSRSKSTPPESHLVKASPSTADNLYPPGYQHAQQKDNRNYDPRQEAGGFVGASNYVDGPMRSPNDYQGQYTGSGENQSQRPPPGTYSQPPGPPTNPQYSGTKHSKYGYIHTSRSTPVTPIPPQQSQSPSASSHRMEPRSHSPGPVRRAVTPKGNEYYNSQPSILPQNRGQQYPRSDSQAHVYQNHPLSNNRGDNSYENVPTGYYYPATPSSVAGPMQNGTHDSVSSSNDYHMSSSHLNTPQDHYGPTAYRISGGGQGGGNAARPMDQRSQSRGPDGVPMTPQYSQNVPARNPSPTKSLTSMPPSPGFMPQPKPSASVPHFTPSRNKPNPNPGYSSQPQMHRPPAASQPPVYNAPPGYHDRRTSYVDPRESNQVYTDRPDRRDPRNQYHKQ